MDQFEYDASRIRDVILRLKEKDSDHIEHHLLALEVQFENVMKERSGARVMLQEAHDKIKKIEPLVEALEKWQSDLYENDDDGNIELMTALLEYQEAK